MPEAGPEGLRTGLLGGEEHGVALCRVLPGPSGPALIFGITPVFESVTEPLKGALYAGNVGKVSADTENHWAYYAELVLVASAGRHGRWTGVASWVGRSGFGSAPPTLLVVTP